MHLTDADIDSHMGITSLLLLSFFLVLKDGHYEDRVILVGIPDQLLISHPFCYPLCIQPSIFC